jgi:hypothetical protein
MSNTFASISASVSGVYKVPNFTRCEAFNPKATLSKWAPAFVCVKNGMFSYGGSGAIALAIAARGREAPEYGSKSFEIVNCRLRTVAEYNGPPMRQNVLCFTCESDGMVGSTSRSLFLFCFLNFQQTFDRRKDSFHSRKRNSVTLFSRFFRICFKGAKSLMKCSRVELQSGNR